MAKISIKRVYEQPAKRDGRRYLVERLRPRGVKKESLAAQAWVKEVAPSSALRTWFAHRAQRWQEFRKRYRAELEEHPEAWRPLLQAARESSVTLLYSAHDTAHNSAVVLREFLAERA